MERKTDRCIAKDGEVGMTESIQEHFEGSSIQKWELDHGIVRVVRDGCEYVVCTNWQRFNEQLEAEKRARMRDYIADQQAQAYLGERA